MKNLSLVILALCGLGIIACAASEPNGTSSASRTNTAQSISGNWKIVRLGAEPIAQNPQTANIEFENGRISGIGFCNRYGGEIKGRMPNISFGPIMATEMACMENGLMDKEAKYFAMLGEVKSIAQNGNELQFKNQSGAVIAVFRK